MDRADSPAAAAASTSKGELPAGVDPPVMRAAAAQEMLTIREEQLT
jgi:hypothetical protein